MRPDFVDQPDERQLIEQIGRLQRDAIEQVLDAPRVRRARAADDAEHLVALVEQQLGEIRTVLAGDAGDERAFVHGKYVRARRTRTVILTEKFRHRINDVPDLIVGKFAEDR